MLISNISFTQFSSNISTLNPAMSGFLDKKFGHIQYGNHNFNEDAQYNGVSGLFNYSADQINSGVGLNFNQSQYNWSHFTTVGGSYQYTFKFSETFKLAVGTSLNYVLQDNRGSHIMSNDFSNKDYLKLSLGAAVKWRGLNAGVSFSNIDLLSDSQSSVAQLHPNRFNPINIHVWYDFQISDDFILSPNVVTGAHSHFNLRGEHYNRVWWNVGYGYRNSLFVGGGVRVFDNFHLGYNVGVSLHNKSLYHRFSISYRLGK